MKRKQQITSARQLAELVERSNVAVSKWLKDSRWQFGPPPWPRAVVPQIKAWAAEMLAPNPAAGMVAADPMDARTERRAKIRLLIERGTKLQIERQLLTGDLIRRQDVEDRECRQAQAVKQELMGAKLLALKMEGLTLLQREILLENWARGVCNKFATARDE